MHKTWKFQEFYCYIGKSYIKRKLSLRILTVVFNILLSLVYIYTDFYHETLLHRTQNNTVNNTTLLIKKGNVKFEKRKIHTHTKAYTQRVCVFFFFTFLFNKVILFKVLFCCVVTYKQIQQCFSPPPYYQELFDCSVHCLVMLT